MRKLICRTWIICARVTAGVGVAHMNAVVPTWVSEVPEAAHRGRSFSVICLANYTGIAFAYWLSFGLSFIDGGMGPIRWRLSFAINGIFPLFLFFLLPFFPESPHYLMLKDSDAEALEVLAAKRSNGGRNNKSVLNIIKEVRNLWHLRNKTRR